MGAVTAFSVIFELKTLDVMALAFVASKADHVIKAGV